ncbi:hypothetical protein [Nonomuraea sp. SBT364]|uniref:hypothetical protein n=1 Tax=Nonomuraea sp. SBT364 TaxID=1580530 RepID=UPI00066C9CA0|nr:hypothetical protein [Nonomuraea sp. SBT364]
MDTATTTTTAEELKTAATRVREAARGTAAGPWKASPVWSPDAAVTSAVYSHAHPAGTPESEVVASGQKRYRKGGLRNPCNAVWIALANPDLAEPLASWLEETARQYDAPPCDDPTGVCNHCERRDDFVNALHVARAINGGAR